MAKKNLIMVLSVLVIAVGAGLIFFSLRSPKPTPSSPNTNTGDTNNQSSDHQNHETHSGPTDASSTQAVAVTIQEFAFKPASVTVKKGTTVTWTNQDDIRHNVLGNGANSPRSELLGKGESYSYTFNATGSFNYICGPHPTMKGSVTVTD